MTNLKLTKKRSINTNLKNYIAIHPFFFEIDTNDILKIKNTKGISLYEYPHTNYFNATKQDNSIIILDGKGVTIYFVNNNCVYKYFVSDYKLKKDLETFKIDFMKKSNNKDSWDSSFINVGNTNNDNKSEKENVDVNDLEVCDSFLNDDECLESNNNKNYVHKDRNAGIRVVKAILYQNKLAVLFCNKEFIYSENVFYNIDDFYCDEKGEYILIRKGLSLFELTDTSNPKLTLESIPKNIYIHNINKIVIFYKSSYEIYEKYKKIFEDRNIFLEELSDSEHDINNTNVLKKEPKYFYISISDILIFTKDLPESFIYIDLENNDVYDIEEEMYSLTARMSDIPSIPLLIRSICVYDNFIYILDEKGVNIFYNGKESEIENVEVLNVKEINDINEFIKNIQIKEDKDFIDKRSDLEGNESHISVNEFLNQEKNTKKLSNNKKDNSSKDILNPCPDSLISKTNISKKSEPICPYFIEKESIKKDSINENETDSSDTNNDKTISGDKKTFSDDPDKSLNSFLDKDEFKDFFDEKIQNNKMDKDLLLKDNKNSDSLNDKISPKIENIKTDDKEKTKENIEKTFPDYNKKNLDIIFEEKLSLNDKNEDSHYDFTKDDFKKGLNTENISEKNEKIQFDSRLSTKINQKDTECKNGNFDSENKKTDKNEKFSQPSFLNFKSLKEDLNKNTNEISPTSSRQTNSVKKIQPDKFINKIYKNEFEKEFDILKNEIEEETHDLIEKFENLNTNLNNFNLDSYEIEFEDTKVLLKILGETYKKYSDITNKDLEKETEHKISIIEQYLDEIKGHDYSENVRYIDNFIKRMGNRKVCVPFKVFDGLSMGLENLSLNESKKNYLNVFVKDYEEKIKKDTEKRMKSYEIKGKDGLSSSNKSGTIKRRDEEKVFVGNQIKSEEIQKNIDIKEKDFDIKNDSGLEFNEENKFNSSFSALMQDSVVENVPNKEHPQDVREKNDNPPENILKNNVGSIQPENKNNPWCIQPNISNLNSNSQSQNNPFMMSSNNSLNTNFFSNINNGLNTTQNNANNPLQQFGFSNSISNSPFQQNIQPNAQLENQNNQSNQEPKKEGKSGSAFSKLANNKNRFL